jgi:hypothetical protein
MFDSNGDITPPCGGACHRVAYHPVSPSPSLQPLSHQLEHLPVADPLAHQVSSLPCSMLPK